MKTLTVSDETYELIKNQLRAEEKTDFSCLNDLVGGSYFFRTVTYHLTGRIKQVLGNLLILEDAAWIADSGRFTQAIKDGVLSEVGVGVEVGCSASIIGGANAPPLLRVQASYCRRRLPRPLTQRESAICKAGD